jgi:hypothetical protein
VSLLSLSATADVVVQLLCPYLGRAGSVLLFIALSVPVLHLKAADGWHIAAVCAAALLSRAEHMICLYD